MRAEAGTEHRSQFKALTMGILVGYAITCIVFLGYSMLITYTSMSEKNMPIVVAVTTLLSVVVAGFDAARGADRKGWLWGMGAGLVYVVILAVIMMLALKNFTIDSRTVTMAILSVAGGGLGGVLGINLKK
ncbi:MAG: TIGR04086 family membrane protein [Clostridiales bacterium]|jgi:putative membrane protein (TIGR04086 family)|nr:TIGR04086 family membrane protein [Clostridiales bacterium]